MLVANFIGVCGRFTLIAPAKLHPAFPAYRFPSSIPRYNVAPTQAVLALRNDGTNVAEMLVWGMGGNINARSETVTVKPSFKHAARERRAIVFADGYYEWKSYGDGKQPYYVRRRDGEPFAFAALHDTRACTLITTAAAGGLAEIHHRMPVILSEAARERWLDEAPLDEVAIGMLLAERIDALEYHPVSLAVNRVSNDAPHLVAPIAPPEQPSLF